MAAKPNVDPPVDKPKLDEDDLPIVDPPRREDQEGARRPLRRLGRSWKIGEAWMAYSELGL